MEKPDDELRRKLRKGFGGREPPDDRKERILKEARSLRSGAYRPAMDSALRSVRGRQGTNHR